MFFLGDFRLSAGTDVLFMAFQISGQLECFGASRTRSVFSTCVTCESCTTICTTPNRN